MDQLHELRRDLLHGLESFADSPHGVWALVVLSFAESSFFPLPPDVLLIALCLVRPDLAFWFAAICAAASVAGGVAGCAIGLDGGRPLLQRLFRADRVRAVESYYDRYNAWATGIAGLTPLPYKVFTISGGAFAIDFKIFVLASVVSRSLRFFLVAAIVFWLGDATKPLIDENLAWLKVAFVVLLASGFWIAGRGARRASRGQL